MMGMVLIVDMSEFIETSMILGLKLARISMEKHSMTNQVSQLLYLMMDQYLLLGLLKMMAMVQIAGTLEFIKMSMIIGHKLAQISTEKLQTINQVVPSIFQMMVLSLLLVPKAIVETN